MGLRESQMIPQNTIVEVVREGIVLPQVFGNHIRFARCSGVVKSSGDFVSNSGIVRGYDPQVFLSEHKRIDKSVIYLGSLRYDHYGHFLLESTVRLWYLEKIQEGEQIVFSVQPGWDGELPSFINDFFHLYGKNILERVIYIREPTQFREITIPPCSFIAGESIYTNEFISPFKRVASHVKANSHDKIYVSRTKFKNGSTSLFGEEEIERNFRKNGFHVIYPERLSLEKQIAFFKGARVVAGVLGTATHSIVFSNPGTELLLLLRSPSHEPNQSVVQSAAGIKVVELKAYREILPVPLPHFGPCILGMTREMKSLFNERGMKDYANRGVYSAKYLQDYLSSFEKALFSEVELQPDCDYKLNIKQICHYITCKNKLQATWWRIVLLWIMSHLFYGRKKKFLKQRYRTLRMAMKASVFVSYEHEG